MNPDDVLEKLFIERNKRNIQVKSEQEKDDEAFAQAVFNNADGESIKRALDVEEDELKQKTDKRSTMKKSSINSSSIVQNMLGIKRKEVTSKFPPDVLVLVTYSDSE